MRAILYANEPNSQLASRQFAASLGVYLEAFRESFID